MSRVYDRGSDGEVDAGAMAKTRAVVARFLQRALLTLGAAGLHPVPADLAHLPGADLPDVDLWCGSVTWLGR